jgi:hypothetical protein
MDASTTMLHCSRVRYRRADWSPDEIAAIDNIYAPGLLRAILVRMSGYPPYNADDQLFLDDARKRVRMEKWASGAAVKEAETPLSLAACAIGLIGFSLFYWLREDPVKIAAINGAILATVVVIPAWTMWWLNNLRRFGLPKSKKLREKIAALEIDLRSRA